MRSTLKTHYYLEKSRTECFALSTHVVAGESVSGVPIPIWEVGISLNNLGSLLEDIGRLQDAEPLYRKSLEIWRNTLGAEHPRVGTSLNNLASLLQDMGRLQDAEPLYRESLEIRRKTLGEEHPNVGQSLSRRALAICNIIPFCGMVAAAFIFSL